MLAAAIKALTQMFSRPFRTVLLKAVGLAIALLAVLAIVLYRLLSWLTGAGGTWVEGALGPHPRRAFADAELCAHGCKWLAFEIAH